jgi:ribosomal protein S15P/S13E
MMMETAHTSETSVDIQLRTRQYMPEDSELLTRRRENLNSHIDSC